MALAAADKTMAGPVNASFETGDFTGWTVSIPNGTSQYPIDRGSIPAGSAAVISSFELPTATYPEGSYFSPMDGGSFAAVGSAASGHFTVNLTYDISVSQSFSLEAGDTLLGWAAFFNGDPFAQDTAWVNVLSGAGVSLSTPWQAVSGVTDGSSGATAYLTASPWTLWQWEAPATGIYTLALGVTTFGDDVDASYGFFDDINVIHPTVVPEPSSIILLAGGLISFLGVLNWRKAKK